ncbi:MAG: VOC family protein [Flavobacteriaceae bacterium]|nr:VOC family protein [Flavobacteriaceae bacterium]
MLTPFHLAVPVRRLDECVAFYTEILGCAQGRSTDAWADLNFFGHQFVLHKAAKIQPLVHNSVDEKAVPVPHFGVILSYEDFFNLVERLKANAIEFIIEPYLRFEGQKGEQATMFFNDPDGNCIEIKAFKDFNAIFEH